MPSILVPLMRSCRKDFERTSAETTDAVLLERYARSRDPVSFELLCWRHGPMVRGVCRRLLADRADIDDAYQAIFIILTQRTHSLRPDSVLAAWLHRVAWRTALNARRAAKRRAASEAKAARPEAKRCDPADAAVQREALQFIDAAIARLPARYREPFVLCELEGRSREAAARELGIPLGTLDSRLARARDKLRSRLRFLALPSLAAGSVSILVHASPALAQTLSPTALQLAAGFGAIATKKILIAATTAFILLAGATYGTVMMGQKKAVELPKKGAESKEAPVPPAMNYLDPEGAPLPAGALARIGSQRFRHGADISNVTYSPDSKWLASASYHAVDCGVRVWDAETGRELFRIPLKYNGDSEANRYMEDPFIGLGFSPDSRTLSIVEPNSIRTWDIEKKAEVFKFDLPTTPGQDRFLMIASITPDGRHALTGWWKGPLELRSLADGKVLKEIDVPLKEEDCFLAFVTFYPDGKKFVLSAQQNTRVDTIFDIHSLKKLGEIPVPSGGHWGRLRFLGSEREIAILIGGKGERPDELRIIEPSSGKILRSTRLAETATSFDVSPDGKSIVVGYYDENFVQVLDASTLKETGRLTAEENMIDLSMAPNGKRLAGIFQSRAIISVWNMASGQYLPSSADPVKYDDARFSADSRSIVLDDHAFRPSIDWMTGKIARTSGELCSRNNTYWPRLSPDGRIKVLEPESRDAKGSVTLRIVDVASGKEIHKLEGHSAEVWGTDFSADGRRLATGGGEVLVWNVETGKILRKFAVDASQHHSQVLLTRDGKRLIIYESGGGKANGKISIFDVDTGLRLVHFEVDAAPYSHPLLLTHNDKRLIIYNTGDGKANRIISIFDVDTGLRLARIDGPINLSDELALSPNDRYLAGGCESSVYLAREKLADVIIWDASTGRVLHTLPNHFADRLEGGKWCDFSPDSRLLATGDDRGRLRLWETATGQEVLEFTGHKSTVMPRFSPDGKLLVASSTDAPCYIWEVIPSKNVPLNEGAAWKDLADDDAKKAFAAVRALAANPERAIALLGSRLRKFERDEKEIVQWIADLDSPRFAIREEATKQLISAADMIEPQLRKAREKAPIEAKARLDKILESLAKLTPDRIRSIRAIQVLNLIGTPAALKIVERIQD